VTRWVGQAEALAGPFLMAAESRLEWHNIGLGGGFYLSSAELNAGPAAAAGSPRSGLVARLPVGWDPEWQV
jgi:hypothetical protein